MLLLLPFLSVIPAGNLLCPFATLLAWRHATPRIRVYILSSRSRNLYIGMTNNLRRRTEIHRKRVQGSYTGRYAIHRLVYFEYFRYVRSAIAREKQLKHWTRGQKIDLIERVNPTWEDLYLTLQKSDTRERPEADSLRE